MSVFIYTHSGSAPLGLLLDLEYMGISKGCTYDHLHGDGDGGVEGGVPPIFGHHCQVDQSVGNLLVVQRPGHADH